MNEFTENEFLPNFELKFRFFRKFDENHLHSKVRENTLALTHKISENVWFCSGDLSYD